MAAVTEPHYLTREGELVTLEKLRSITEPQPWFEGSFLEWCVRKQFIVHDRPIAYGRHSVSIRDDGRSSDLDRNLAIARDLYGGEVP